MTNRRAVDHWLPDYLASGPARYVCAIGLVMLATIVREWATPFVGDRIPFATFFAAIAISGFFLGRGPAIAVAMFGAFITNYSFVGPYGKFSLNDLSSALQMLFYAAVSVTFIYIIDALLRSRQSLGESESRFREMADNAPILIWTADKDSACDYFNKSWLEFTGRTLEQELGRGWEEGIHPEDRERLLRTYEGAFAAKAPFSLEYRRRRADGEYRWILASGVPRISDQGEFVGYVGTGIDITERKRAEHALRESEERFRIATDAGRVGVWDWDILTDTIAWSDRIYQIHGISRDQFDGKLTSLAKLLHPEDAPKIQEAIRRALEESAEYKDLEFRAIRPDGEVRNLITSGSVLFDGGRPVRMVGATVDITERKRAEDALRKSEKLAAAGRLAASVAHEINNPLEAVTNLIYLARLEAVATPTQRLLEAADVELRRIGQITKQSLGFYRETSQPTVFSPAEAIGDVLYLYERKMLTRNASLERKLDPEARIEAIPGEIKQVVSNLLLNALDAMGEDGRLHVRVRSESNCVRIVIADTGSGIPAEIRPHIMEPFVTTKRDIGTGLGLWVSKQIVEKHGGRLTFRSSTGTRYHGTVFVMTFPAAVGEFEKKAPQRAMKAS